jgi:hypothetical protein
MRNGWRMSTPKGKAGLKHLSSYDGYGEFHGGKQVHCTRHQRREGEFRARGGDKEGVFTYHLLNGERTGPSAVYLRIQCSMHWTLDMNFIEALFFLLCFCSQFILTCLRRLQSDIISAGKSSGMHEKDIGHLCCLCSLPIDEVQNHSSFISCPPRINTSQTLSAWPQMLCGPSSSLTPRTKKTPN